MKKSRIRIKLKAYDHEVVDNASSEIIKTVKRVKAKVAGPIPLPTQIKRYTVLRSPHVHITSREQFEIRIHKRMIDIINPDENTMDALSRLELPNGVDVEIKQI